MKLRKKVGAIAIASLAITGLGVGTSHAANTVTGSGSTFIKNLFDACIPQFNDASGDTVSYSGGGSGAGRTAFTGGTTNFAGTDSTYSSSDTPPADYTYVPLIAGPVAIPYKLSGFTGTLKLSTTTLAKIFSGAITSWGDAALVADNPSLSGNSTNITVVYRSDSSGTSAGFTSYLRAVEPTIFTKAGSSTFTSALTGSAPGNFTAKSGSDALISYVAATNGAISYVELSYQKDAVADGVKAASVKNASGAFITPTSVSAAAALGSIPTANFNTTTGWVDPDFTTSVATAYPITILSFGIAHKTYSANNETVKNFFDYILNTCASAQAPTLGYAQLTGAALSFAKTRSALVSSENRPAAAPAVTTTLPKASLAASVKAGKAIKASNLTLAAGLKVTKKSVITLTVKPAGAKFCKVAATTVKGLKAGSCSVVVKVKTGASTKQQTVKLTVLK